MMRVACAVLWTFVLTFVFLILSAVGFGVVAFFTVKGGDPAQNQAAVDDASRKWMGTMFFGSLAAAVVVSAWGVLPGTRRRPAGTAGPGEPADCAYPADFDFPPTRPIIAVPVGTSENPPPELAALGPPLSLHPPGILASMSGLTRLATFVMGLVLLIGPAVAVSVAGPEQIPPSVVGPLVIGGFLAGLICLALALPSKTYRYQVHRDALVVSDRKTMRIIPWDQIQAIVPELPLLKDLTLVTRDGQQVPIKSVGNYHQLFDSVFVRVRDHLLPLMITKANAGRMVEFGPLGVSIDAVQYKGQTVPWDDVTGLVKLVGSGFRKLMVYRRGILSFWPFCQVNLNTLPNDLLLLELLKQVAPPRLLVSADQARW